MDTDGLWLTYFTKNHWQQPLSAPHLSQTTTLKLHPPAPSKLAHLRKTQGGGAEALPNLYWPSHQRSSASCCTKIGSPISMKISSLCRGMNLWQPRWVASSPPGYGSTGGAGAPQPLLLHLAPGHEKVALNTYVDAQQGAAFTLLFRVLTFGLSLPEYQEE